MMRSSTPLKNAISAIAVLIIQLGEAISREAKRIGAYKKVYKIRQGTCALAQVPLVFQNSMLYKCHVSTRSSGEFYFIRTPNVPF